MKVTNTPQLQLIASMAVRSFVSGAFYFGYWFSRSRA